MTKDTSKTISEQLPQLNLQFTYEETTDGRYSQDEAASGHEDHAAEAVTDTEGLVDHEAVTEMPTESSKLKDTEEMSVDDVTVQPTVDTPSPTGEC